MRWLSDEGVGVGVDRSGAIGVIVKSTDADRMRRLRNLLLAILPKKAGSSLPIQRDYRGIVAYELKGLLLAQIDRVLMVSNRPEMGKAIVDLTLDQGDSFATSPLYLDATQQIARSSQETVTQVAQGFADMATIRELGIGRNLLVEKTSNFFAEVVLGGVLANLRSTSLVIANVGIDDSGLGVHLTTPHQRDWEAPRKYFFGDDEIAKAPPLAKVNDRVFAASAHRDLSQVWLRSGDLLSDRAVDGLAKADSQLSIFFSGKDFGEDVLGSFGNQIQLVGRVPPSSDQTPRPAIRLP